ncbi:restriction endonuclease subunit S domain-containing protein [Mycobacteroides abscessus]|uniref:hypothetical protein n=1 Tax=Mycobacteroides abscessus TaxID=36809 RepID=UPI001054A430|nr:hypothetical protein [Mycobacteroides abscessus]
MFEYLPPEADRLSVSRTTNLANYRVKAGELLQTCSGRNLGPLTIADDYLARFALSHDMVRIRIPDETERYYTLAVLQSAIGQHLLRGDLNGSVIDHISDTHVASLRLPFIDAITAETAKLMRSAAKTRGKSRIALHDAVDALNRALAVSQDIALREGWTVKAATLGTRLDAAFHSTHVGAVKDKLLDMGGVTLGSVARVTKPGGRYKTYYVAPGHGTPLLSGTQILCKPTPSGRSTSHRGASPREQDTNCDRASCAFKRTVAPRKALGTPRSLPRNGTGGSPAGMSGGLSPRTRLTRAGYGRRWLAMQCGNKSPRSHVVLW